MRVRSLWRTTPCQILAILLVLAPCQAGAEPGDDVADAAPLHAHGKRYGAGWECDWGYGRSNQSCAVIKLPANAHLTSIGRDWECDRGYRKADGACAQIKLPSNAFLSAPTPDPADANRTRRE
jgi:hypothetical protein